MTVGGKQFGLFYRSANDNEKENGFKASTPDEAANGRQNDICLHRFLLGKRRPEESLAEEPDGIDSPQEWEKGKSADEILFAKLDLVVVSHLGIRQIHRCFVERVVFATKKF
jgi:hypothetical protein